MGIILVAVLSAAYSIKLTFDPIKNKNTASYKNEGGF